MMSLIYRQVCKSSMFINPFSPVIICKKRDFLNFEVIWTIFFSFQQSFCKVQNLALVLNKMHTKKVQQNMEKQIFSIFRTLRRIFDPFLGLRD